MSGLGPSEALAPFPCRRGSPSSARPSFSTPRAKSVPTGPWTCPPSPRLRHTPVPSARKPLPLYLPTLPLPLLPVPAADTAAQAWPCPARALTPAFPRPPILFLPLPLPCSPPSHGSPAPPDNTLTPSARRQAFESHVIWFHTPLPPCPFKYPPVTFY